MVLVLKKSRISFFWYEQSAFAGNAYAQNNLGHMYFVGEGVKKDIKQAIFWYEKAAIQNHPYAQLNLGMYYERFIDKKIKL